MNKYLSLINKEISKNYKGYSIIKKYRIRFANIALGVLISNTGTEFGSILLVADTDGDVTAVDGAMANSLINGAKEIK